MSEPKEVRLFGILVVYCVLNGMVFWVEMNILGGVALMGKMESGMYYLGRGGDLIPVATAWYYVNYIHNILLFIHVGVVLVMGFYLKMTGRLSAYDDSSTVTGRSAGRQDTHDLEDGGFKDREQ